MLNILAEAMLEAMVSPLKTRAGGDPACPSEIVAAGNSEKPSWTEKNV